VTDTYDKLVRDKIPSIIRATGRDCVVETMTEEAYQQALRAKLAEEAREAAAAASGDLIGGLADILEVIDALCAAHGHDPAAGRTAQDRKRAERGGFTLRLRLRTVE
jgi:predicted house-cleaning noncanonical NTP pyrophosphatase (MazG superfamily)